MAGGRAGARPVSQGHRLRCPPVLDDAMRLFDVLEFADRIEFLPGDAREEVPAVADIYVLKSVLQQHDDKDAAAILENCRRAMTPGARLVVHERLMPEDPSADPEAIMIDLHMMAITGGKTRTLAEMESLISSAGLSVAGHRKTSGGMTAIDVRTP
ncbi:methyltransferase [Methyloceanibacter stevinii]|uniref:methyltransferase n=1 Tax=Methyloceanibacter stevinii TaxID=1774970 RepID=UPI00244ED6F1|nr:methyltransferase [Methyloceanibacter stevinii]